MGLVTIIYCLRVETSLFVASYDSQGYGGGINWILSLSYITTDGQSASRPVGQSVLVSSPHLELMTRFFIIVRPLRVFDMGRPL
jgi:hypothetical protein